MRLFSTSLPALKAFLTVAVGFLLACLLGACSLTSTPKTAQSVSYDENGRAVVRYQTCTKPLLGGGECHTETVVHNYRYRTLGQVDCYERPLPGRTAMRTGP